MKFLIISALEAYDQGKINFTFTTETNEKLDDTIMTKENKEQYRQAKKDLENGINIISWEELKAKHL